MAEIESKEIYYNYRMFKNVFAPEDYLQSLPLNLAYTFVHFRTLNHRLPIQTGRVMNLPYEIFHHFIVKMQMLIDFSLFCIKNERLLVNLAHFLKFLMSEF